jgi:NitT/TauT family transport system permease protein
MSATLAGGPPARIMPGVVRRGLGRLLILALAIAGFGLFWQAMSALVGTSALAPPIPSFAWAWRILTVPRYWPHLQETFLAFFYAWCIAIGCGLLAGLVLGAHRLSGEVAEPILMALYSVPKVTLYPIVLLLFGIGIDAKIAFGAIHGVLPVALLTMNAIRHLPRVHRRSAQSMRLSRLQTILFVLLPASLPEIASGVRMGTALTLLGVMVGELFASQRGLGFLLMTAIEGADVPRILGVVLIVTVFALVINGAMTAIENRLQSRR